MVGFEPTQCWSQSPMPYRLATPHRPPLSRWLFIWGDLRGSNSWPPEPQSGALPIELRPPHGAPRWIRTIDLCLRRALLYPAELWKQMEQMKGIGPSQPAWKASVLPLNYICKCSYSITFMRAFVKKKLKKTKKVLKIFIQRLFFDKITKTFYIWQFHL